ncbi:MAG: gamma-glutamylcyclotransferase [Alphaproteobacteria bacterium]
MSDVWVFGYGSLVWRPDFPFVERRTATISGWTRRFWQGSTDHRGVPGAPGRVVTLIEEPDAVCWGTAYLIHADDRDDVVSHLDYREKGGYSLHEVGISFPEDALSTVTGLIYIAGPGNPNWLGDASMEEIATQVMESAGPSGVNTEYVLELARALRGMKADDPHVFGLADLIDAPPGKRQA